MPKCPRLLYEGLEGERFSRTLRSPRAVQAPPVRDCGSLEGLVDIVRDGRAGTAGAGGCWAQLINAEVGPYLIDGRCGFRPVPVVLSRRLARSNLRFWACGPGQLARFFPGLAH